jgi:hypothetical protein
MVEPHAEHMWPLTGGEWEQLTNCHQCGLTLLRQFINIADWVVRRVEGIHFVDDRTVRRRVSVDYTVPGDGVLLRGRDGPDVRILPLAMMRRKSMVSFDFRDHDDRPMPLLGLRENQALTRSVIRAWAAAVLGEKSGVPAWQALPEELDRRLEEVIAGEQGQITKAYTALKHTRYDGVTLNDRRFMAVLDRLAGNFVLFGSDSSSRLATDRQVVLRRAVDAAAQHYRISGTRERPVSPGAARGQAGGPDLVRQDRTQPALVRA